MYPRIIWINTIRSMQKEGKKWHIQQALGSGETRTIVVNKLRGNRLFFDKMLRDAHALERLESDFAAEKARLPQSGLSQTSSEIRQIKSEFAASYKGTQAITKKLIEKDHLLPFITFWFGLGLAVIGGQKQFTLDPLVKSLCFSLGASFSFILGWGGLVRATIRQSHICNMFGKIGVKLYEGQAVDPFEIF